MKNSVRWSLTFLSALLLLASFPNGAWMPHGSGYIAWFALLPLLTAVTGEGRFQSAASPRRAAALWYVCAFLFQAGNCYWILLCMKNYGDLSWPLAVLALVVYSAILSCWYGIAGFCMGTIARRSRTWALVAAPFLWVGAEMGRSRVNGIPWCFLGQSQVDARVAQWVAPLVGVLGVSFVVAAFAAAFLLLFPLRRREGPLPILTMIALCLPAVILGEKQSLRHLDGSQTALLLQPNEPLNQSNWARNGYAGQMLAYGNLMASAAGVKPDIIAWPESPAPLRENDPRFREAAAHFAQQYSAPIIIGNSVEEARSPGPGLPPVRQFFNSASFVSPDGAFVGRYDKIHLVPFGEYVPYRDSILFWLHNLTQGVGDLTPGRERVLFRTSGHAFGTFICYESVFPNEVRQFAKSGADVLVNISDDAWYGDTSAPFQHLDQTRMRAIENHRWILLDTNNGVTASIDPAGRIAAAAPRHQALAIEVPFDYVSETTFYTRHGDWFAWLCAASGLGITAAYLVGRT